MKKKSITGIIVVALFIIGIIAALIVYKKVQTMPEKSQIEEEPETVILSADENPFGIEIKKINEDYDLTRNYYKNYDNTGLQKYIIPVIFTDKRTYIAEMRESGYCQYGYESKEEGLVAEITEQQRKNWLELTEKDIKRVIEQNKDEELYHFKISDDYKILYLDVSKEILNSQSTFTAKMSSLMTLTYDSEIYHVLNGTQNWSLQIIVTDMETGKELENIKFPEEDYNLSIETWDNL
ncbi:MAG: hypothetical protein ACLSHE_08705 [Roseburia sp.]|jgi:hypothetical protein